MDGDVYVWGGEIVGNDVRKEDKVKLQRKLNWTLEMEEAIDKFCVFFSLKERNN